MVTCEPRATDVAGRRRRPPDAGRRRPAGAAPRRPSPPLSDDTRLAVEIREPRRARRDGRGARPLRRARGRSISVARRASPTSISATPPTPTRPCRTPSSRSSAHISSYREAWPFEVWFTRILINGCLDRRKARAPPRSLVRRRPRKSRARDEAARVRRPAAPPIPKHRLLARERRARIAAAVDRLDGRQRTVFMLCHYGDCTPREVSAMTGLNESTVRVHLFRAARKLRGLLGGKP